jgi:hypothetical protein
VNDYGNSLFIDNINIVNNDGSLVITNPIPGCIDSNAINYNANGNVDDGSCDYTAFGSQLIVLNQGWNLISSYVIPTSPDLETVLNDVEEQVVIAKDNLGNAYLPDWNFNAIGDLSNNEGYQIKVTADCSITVEGEIITPENTPVQVQEGWNFISYLRLPNANAELVLEEVSAEIVIVKNYLGNAYLPSWDFNGIGDFEPGQGYQLKASSAFELQYISNDSEYRIADLETVKNEVSNKIFSLNTGSNMHLLIPENTWDTAINLGDELYAYDAEGKLIGASKITLPNTLICLWGDDVLTEEKEGLYTAEDVKYKLWNKATGIEREIHVLSNKASNFVQDQIIIATKATENTLSNHIQLMDAVPNPAKNQTLIRLYIENDSELQLELFDIIGNKVLDLAKGMHPKGYHEFHIDVNTISAGSYLYQITCNKERKTKRLEILK